MPEPLVLVALGANLPVDDGANTLNPADTLRAALHALPQAGIALNAASQFFATPCFPAGAGPDYVNACAVVEPGRHDPHTLLTALHAIEARFARRRDARWAGRTLDLDLLGWDDLILPDAVTQRHWRDLAVADQARLAPDRLILPHPRMQDRAFVLVPLAEIAPDWCHPVLGRRVTEMRDALPPDDLAAIRPLP